LGAAFTCAGLDLTPEILPEHASYLDHWLKVLKADKRAIFTAAAHAPRAAEPPSPHRTPQQARLIAHGLLPAMACAEKRVSNERGQAQRAALSLPR
jgi:hypothetical protein